MRNLKKEWYDYFDRVIIGLLHVQYSTSPFKSKARVVEPIHKAYSLKYANYKKRLGLNYRVRDLYLTGGYYRSMSSRNGEISGGLATELLPEAKVSEKTLDNIKDFSVNFSFNTIIKELNK